MERFELLCDQGDWNKCRADPFAACYYMKSRKVSMKIMLIARSFLSLIAASLIAAAVYDSSNRKDFMLYYTHWSLITLVSMFVAGSVVCLLGIGRRYSTPNYVPRHVRLFNILYNVACTTTILSTIVYFIMTFTYSATVKRPVNHVIHSVNSLLVVIEMLANAVPVRLVDVYQPMLFTLTYGTFGIVYHHYTGNFIYNSLAKESQDEILKLALSFLILMFAVYMLIYVISFIKNKMLKVQ